MFLIQRIKGGKSHFVTKIGPKGNILGLTAKREDAPTFSHEQAKLFADFYEASGTYNAGDFQIIDTAKKRVVQTIEAPDPPVDPIAEQMAANREVLSKALEGAKTGPVVTIPESKGVEITTGKGDTKGHPTAKDLAGSAKQ